MAKKNVALQEGKAMTNITNWKKKKKKLIINTVDFYPLAFFGSVWIVLSERTFKINHKEA